VRGGKFCLGDLSLRALAAAIEARKVCEQAHQKFKQKVDLCDFEGCSWTRLHRPTPIACITYASQQQLRLKGAHGKKMRRPKGERRSRACPRSAGGSLPACSLASHRRAARAAADKG